MAAESKIEWTDATFNPWIGCAKISPGCTHCYAEVQTFARAQRAQGRELWGKDAARHRTSPSYWLQAERWNAEAARTGRRMRVFCASLADVFEGRDDLEPWRRDLFALIDRTPNLDWLVLTKRASYALGWLLDDKPRANLWMGTSIENRAALRRIDDLRLIPAAVHFLSIEPLLEDLGDISKYLACQGCGGAQTGNDHGYGSGCPGGHPHDIHWVIVGGESGHDARPMHPDWARSIRDQCVTAGVPFFFKQHGEWAAPDQFPRAFWGGAHTYVGDQYVMKAGKKFTGRALDGRTWDELPGGPR